MDDTKAIRRAVDPGKTHLWFYVIGGLAILLGAYLLIIRPMSAPQSKPLGAISSTNAEGAEGVEGAEGAEGEGAFEHKDFTITRPVGWLALDEEELSKESDYFAYAIRHLSPGALVTVKVEKSDTNDVNVDQLATAIGEKLPGEFEEFKKLGSRTLTTESGHPALVYEYLFAAGPDSQTRQILYVVLTDSKAYYVAAQATASDFEAVRTDVDKILSSFSPR